MRSPKGQCTQFLQGSLRDCPFLRTFFKNPNNAWISDEPPIHPQIRTTMRRIICTPEIHFRISTLTRLDIDLFGLFDHIIVNKYWIHTRQKNNWSKNMFLGVRIYFSFGSQNSQFLVTHPSTKISTLFGYLKYVHKNGPPLSAKRPIICALFFLIRMCPFNNFGFVNFKRNLLLGQLYTQKKNGAKTAPQGVLFGCP